MISMYLEWLSLVSACVFLSMSIYREYFICARWIFSGSKSWLVEQMRKNTLTRRIVEKNINKIVKKTNLICNKKGNITRLWFEFSEWNNYQSILKIYTVNEIIVEKNINKVALKNKLWYATKKGNITRLFTEWNNYNQFWKSTEFTQWIEWDYLWEKHQHAYEKNKVWYACCTQQKNEYYSLLIWIFWMK